MNLFQPNWPVTDHSEVQALQCVIVYLYHADGKYEINTAINFDGDFMICNNNERVISGLDE